MQSCQFFKTFGCILHFVRMHFQVNIRKLSFTWIHSILNPKLGCENRAHPRMWLGNAVPSNSTNGALCVINKETRNSFFWNCKTWKLQHTTSRRATTQGDRSISRTLLCAIIVYHHLLCTAAVTIFLFITPYLSTIELPCNSILSISPIWSNSSSPYLYIFWICISPTWNSLSTFFNIFFSFSKLSITP